MHPCEEKKDGCREFLTLPRTLHSLEKKQGFECVNTLLAQFSMSDWKYEDNHDDYYISPDWFINFYLKVDKWY